KELRQKQKEFFDVENRTKKKQLAEEINRIEWEFIEETLREQGDGENIKKLGQYTKNKSKPFFLWKLYFNDVFYDKTGHPLENPGFDVVIANPPYFPITTLPKEIKKVLLNNNPELVGTFSGKIDIYSFFILLSFKKLLKQNGNLNYIIPKTILSNISFTELRKHIIENYQIDEIVDLEKVFEQVTGTMTYLLLSVFNKPITDSYKLMINNMDLDGRIKKSPVDVELLKTPPSYIWVLSKQKLELIRKIEKNAELLSKKFITKNGVCTGNNAKYLSDKKENEFYRKIRVAKDISKYYIKPSSNYVYYKRELLHRSREEEI
ncbi:MAG: Eco57I restriction-modification methylase domain-containing protein, partial [Nanoarchaeota archaeon]